MYSFNSLKDVTRCYRGPQEMITRAAIGPRAALWEPMDYTILNLIYCIYNLHAVSHCYPLQVQNLVSPLWKLCTAVISIIFMMLLFYLSASQEE